MNLWDFLSSPMDAYERGQVKGGGLLGAQRYTRPELPVANAMRGLLDGGQDRTKRLNSSIDEAMRYFLGPTGIDKRIGAVAELNPVNDIYQAGANMRDGDYIGAATNTAAAAVPLAGAVAAKPLAKTLAQGSDDAGRAIVDALTMYQTGGQKALGDFVADQDGVLKFWPDETYRGSHTAPTRDGYSAPAHQLDGDIYPDDVYSPQAVQYYGTGNPSMDRATFRKVQALRGKPDADVKIYRAVPKGQTDITAGDWVTVNKQYAREHGESWLDGNYDIVEETVPAGELFTDGNSIHEFGWSPSKERIAAATDPVAAAKRAWEASPNDAELRKAYLKARNAPSLSPAQTEAQNVLDLLKSGRADEVTDDMLAAADDMYLFDNYDLPMDEASRMARAEEMGASTDAVHFSKDGVDVASLDSGKSALSPFDAVGTHVGTPEAAMDRFRNTVMTTDQPAKGTTYPLKIQANRPSLSDGQPWDEETLSQALRQRGGYNEVGADYEALNKQLRRDVFDQNDAIAYRNDVESQGNTSYIVPPTNIRSRFARFDPRLSHLRNLSAGIGGMGLLGGLQLDEETRAYLAQ